MDFATRVTQAPTAVPLRMMRCIWRQAAHSPICPDTPRLDGQRALVTGGNAGIGLEISRGPASKRLEELAGGRPLEILVANAGVWPRQHSVSAQGHELAFATNTLGHHLLIRRLLDRGVLTNGRVVVLTGDIYIRARECTSDFTYDSESGGALAYCRSKLGSLWFTAELQRRYPALEVCATHPGVIASSLGGKRTGFSAWISGAMLLDVERGAQTPLWCATQPGLERGAYLHNTMGRLVLSPRDPAADAAQAGKLWARLEELSAPFLAN